MRAGEVIGLSRSTASQIEPMTIEAMSFPIDSHSRIMKSLTARRARRFALAVALLVIVVATLFLAHANEQQSPRWLHSLSVPALVLFVIGLFLYREERHWSRPLKQLQDLLGQIRAGNAPIEELSQVQGALDTLTPMIQQLLRDLRSQKQAVAGLNEEIRQRVATRTVALEREIGSLRQQATRDVLTGLFNRRMLDSFLPQMIERCVNQQNDLSVLMVDVDHFKLLNDTMGHKAGDELLRDIGQIIRSGIREHDAGFRVGGDEFVVVLPGAAPDAASALAQRLTCLVDALTKPLRLEYQPRLSIGVVSMSELVSRDVRELLAKADKRAYEVKLSRRTSSLPLTRADRRTSAA
jgi:diguanylate cyclase (GGDEF)-like protein